MDAIGSPCPKCGGRKVYARAILMSLPPQQDWICALCGAEGRDRAADVIDEYDQLKRKKRQKEEEES